MYLRVNTPNKNVNATLLICSHFPWAEPSNRRLSRNTNGLFLSNIVHKSISVRHSENLSFCRDDPSISEVRHLNMLIRQHEYYTDLASAAHNKRPLYEALFFYFSSLKRGGRQPAAPELPRAFLKKCLKIEKNGGEKYILCFIYVFQKNMYVFFRVFLLKYVSFNI